MTNLTKEQLREKVKQELPAITSEINDCLSGKTTKMHKDNLLRLNAKGALPHWYLELENNGVLPNLDGKTVGSVIEQILVSSVQLHFGVSFPVLNVNPARGVDIPELDLGIKSPSENYCTSEPFFSAYERLIGNEYDVLVLLTDYQSAKLHPPLKIQIKDSKYLTASQLADKNLCKLALKSRSLLLEKHDTELQKVFRFLAYVNQSDWRAKELLRLLGHIENEKEIVDYIAKIRFEFHRVNVKNEKEGKELVDESELDSILEVLTITPKWQGLVNALDNWTIENQKDFARFPNETELQKLRGGKLDGQIGMSYALQWRYNFGALFRAL